MPIPHRQLLCLLSVALLLCGGVASGELHYLGVSVEKHPWRSTLTDWRRSRDWIGQVAASQLDVAPQHLTLLSDPDASALQKSLAAKAGELTKDDLLLVYFGTHQLKNGRILLGDKTEIDAPGLAALLAAMPCRVVFLADVCYARAMEDAADFPVHVVRIYAADDDQKTPNVDLKARFRSGRAFYADTIAAYPPAPEGCSQFGISFLDALRVVRETAPTLPINQIAQTMRRRQAAFAESAKMTRTPDVSAKNLQSWPLRSARAVADAPTADSSDPFAELETLLSLPDAAIDPARSNLLIGKIYDPTVDVDAHLARIDRMAADLRPQITAAADPAAKAAVIAQALYARDGFTAIAEPFTEDFLVHKLLASKRGRCAAFVSLYLALAHRLDLPYAACCIPEHVLIRTADGVNLETTLRGVAIPDQNYAKHLRGIAQQTQDSFYQTRLSRRQHAATLLSPLANALREDNRLPLARRAAELAIEINPNDAEAWNNFGMILRLQNEPAAAAAYDKALAIHPNFAEAWNNRGVLAADTADKIACFKKAIAIKPNLGPAWKNLALAYDAAGQPALAWAAVRRCIHLKEPLPPGLLERVKPQ